MIDALLSWSGLPNVHPAIVHFPIALLPAALLFDLCALLWKRHQWLRPAAAALYTLAAVSAVAAVLSGRNAAGGLVAVPAKLQPHIGDHSDWGHYTAWAIGLVALCRLVTELSKRWRERNAVWITTFALGILSTVFLVRAADLGGTLVYQHGLAVRRAVSAAPGDRSSDLKRPRPEGHEWLTDDDGSVVWRPGESTASPLGTFLTPAPGSSLGALSIDPGAAGAGGLRLRVMGRSLALFPDPNPCGDVQIEAELDLADFEGSVGLAHHVRDASNADFFLISIAPTNGVARLTARRDGRETDLDSSPLLLEPPFERIAVSVSGKHLKGMVDGRAVVHAHETMPTEGGCGLAFDGRGVIRLRSLRLTRLDST